MFNHFNSGLGSVLGRFLLIGLAYFLTAKLGLMVPYKESVATLIWLPTGIAIGAILRWGKINALAIFIASALVNFSMGLPIFTSTSIACGNVLAPLLGAYLLQKLAFNHGLIMQRDIGLMFSVAACSMLISATGGTLSLFLSDLINTEQIARIWFIWWVGDTVGVLLALPLVLNIQRKAIRITKQQFYQLMAWLGLFVLCELFISALVTGLNKQFMLSVLLILPVLIWASMNFGIVGGSLVVIALSSIAVWSAAQGYGSFYSLDIREGLFSLWMFMVTLVLTMLLICVLQSRRNLAEMALRSNDKKLRAMIDSALDGIVSIDEHDVITEFNPAAEHIFGYTKNEVIGKPLAEIIVPPKLRDAHRTKQQAYAKTGVRHIFDKRAELTAMHADGTEFPVELTITSLAGDGASGLTGFIRDISQQKKALQEIENFAYYDTLTGLPNRRLLIDRFQRAVVSSKRSNAYCAMIFVDLDNFKLLNDSKGHDVGDLLLKEVADRIQRNIRAGDTVARLSGDEFIVIIENLDALQNVAYSQISEIAQKLLIELNKPYQLNLFEFNTSASLGITLFNDDLLSFEDFLRQADIAMYQAKAEGRNTYRFYDQLTQEIAERSFGLESSLLVALKNQEFYLNYQSIVDADQEVIAAEVLLRWTHPVLGTIGPTEFIPIAEKTNQIIRIGYWVLQQACLQLKAWESSPKLSKIRLSVNISAKQFLYVNFIQELRDIIHSTGIDPDLLKLELTETAVIDNIEDVITKMLVLKEIGVRIAMDDFGMGHSSLVYLKKLPLTQIKVDQSFVNDMLTDSNDVAIIQMIIAIGKTIQCNIVAEGVEKVEQFELLKEFGCNYFQGYYFSRPLNIEAFEKMVNA